MPGLCKLVEYLGGWRYGIVNVAEVPSTFQLKAGAAAPDFTLPDADGVVASLAGLAGDSKAVVVAFVCNHCPFVVHVADAVGLFSAEYAARGVQFIAVNSNDVENYPADAPEKMKAFAGRHGWDFPYLYDQSQDVAKSYAAACTPDFYLFDESLKLAYAGQFDDSRPGSRHPVDGADLRAATEAVLAGENVATPWRPSTGCNIKWRPGRAPDYFG